MHLDTVFSFCDRDLVTVFPEVVNDRALHPRPDESKPHGIDIRREESFLDVVAEALKLKKLRVVETGGNSFAADASSGTTATTWWHRTGRGHRL
jgi:arginine deiminase